MNLNNISITFDIDVVCECGYKFSSREISFYNNEITVPSCPKCMEAKDKNIDAIEKDRDEQAETINELEKENKKLEDSILRLSINKSLGKEES